MSDRLPSSVYMCIRVGPFCPFLEFHESHGFAVPLGKIWGTTKFFRLGSKTRESIDVYDGFDQY